MIEKRSHSEAVAVTVGYAVGSDGKGLAFAALGDDESPGVLRVVFSVRVRPALRGRDLSYAAANAVLEALLRRGLRSVVVRLADERLPLDLDARGSLPAALTVPYVALRCRLNRFAEARIEAAGGSVMRDLTARAQAEALLDIAA